jgi:hypothetical protein
MSPAGGALRLAEVEASRAADSIDWDVLARSETAKLVEWDQAESLATALLDPITPRVLAPFLEG